MEESNPLHLLNQVEAWIPEIIRSLRKELKKGYLRSQPALVKKHFPKMQLDKIPLENLLPACVQELKEQNESLADWLVQGWLFKNTEIFHFFKTHLLTLNSDLEAIESIPEDLADLLIREGEAQFGAERTYIFSMLNKVAFSEEQRQRLYDLAHKEQQEKLQTSALSAEASQKEEDPAISKLREEHNIELAKLMEKYEKRLLGMQEKYLQDTAGLKKQIAQLQRKLQGVSS